MGKIAKTQHTPGQWRIASSDECKAMNSTMAVVTDTQSGIIVVANVWKTNDKIPSIDRDPQAAANARLIAAAPELLRALRTCVEFIGDGMGSWSFVLAAKAAIAKVEGTPVPSAANSEKRMAFFVMETQMNGKGEYNALIAVEGEQGYHKTDWYWGKDFKVAQDIADERNARLGLSKKEAAMIQGSTMRGMKMPEADDEVSHE